MIVRMVEMAAHPEAHQDLVDWACAVAVPELERNLDHISSEVFTSADNRLVVISRWRSAPVPLAAPPTHWLRREAHSWDFSPVDR
ncbi:hypothetical protein [Cryptosporangium phraense]|uniref:ABM domain-containing protein n=1 Tax=Cryptosporangium phraense TaxID=2593070 RepID=A0A545AYJ8_9ACTN|nr:hypothetical protein [Cryptosporangium phraense]TQS46403.1 hypothetical protein FL583_03150 [Cryptosporangium phraense]